MATLTNISNAWATRPADQNYFDLNDAAKAARAHAAQMVEKADVMPATLRVESTSNGDVALVGKGGVPAPLTHWSFGQLSSMAGFPGGPLRTLPATLASQVLNYKLKERFGTVDNPENPKDRVNLLVKSNGGLVIHSINSDAYSRIWNYELLERCAGLTAYGWTNPRTFNTGDQVATCWVSDHDCILFQTNDSNLISVPGPDGTTRQLRRGYIMSNSEVGAAKWRTQVFIYDYMCCNRMIWGVTEMSEIAVRHVGNAHDRMQEQFDNFVVQVTRYKDSSGNLEVERINRARRTEIGATREQVIDKVFSTLKGALTRTAITAGYDAALATPDTDVSPNYVWGLANGLTRYSQTIQYADERVAVERGAGKLVEAAF